MSGCCRSAIGEDVIFPRLVGSRIHVLYKYRARHTHATPHARATRAHTAQDTYRVLTLTELDPTFLGHKLLGIRVRSFSQY